MNSALRSDARSSLLTLSSDRAAAESQEKLMRDYERKCGHCGTDLRAAELGSPSSSQLDFSVSITSHLRNIFLDSSTLMFISFIISQP